MEVLATLLFWLALHYSMQNGKSSMFMQDVRLYRLWSDTRSCMDMDELLMHISRRIDPNVFMSLSLSVLSQYYRCRDANCKLFKGR